MAIYLSKFDNFTKNVQVLVKIMNEKCKRFYIKWKKRYEGKVKEKLKGFNLMKILLAGDSTVAHLSQQLKGMYGWGERLAELMSPIEVLNFSKAGASTDSFEEEGLLTGLIDAIEDGDLVLIQFGHNDQKNQHPNRLNHYYQHLKRWVEQIKLVGGQPILCSPVERRNFCNGQALHSLREFQLVLKKLSKEQEIPFFDLNQYTLLLYQSLGEKKSRDLFAHFSPIKKDYPIGLADDTHFSKKGATEIARYIAIRLRDYVSSEELFDKFYYGACMYPEVWDKETMEIDVKHMKKLKMNFARIGEFVWSSLEPEEGVYDFTLLKDALNLYQENEIDVCVCIPTPTPPRWMTYLSPERLIKNSDGSVMVHGSRQHVCTNNEYFRQKAYKLTKKIAAVVSAYPNVVAIQLDNEFKCHVDLCYCDTCKNRWHEWLKDNYFSVENMNEAWGTKIWSQEYADFTEVVMPEATPFLHNSSLMNAFRKFTAETINEFAHNLTHHIRMVTDLPVTHNTAFGFNLLNEELFSELDVVGFDTYPSAENYPSFLFNMDAWRNVKAKRQEMLLLETCTSHTGHIENYVRPKPSGYLQTEVFTGFAGGLKSFNYWHFRGHRFGVEQTHSSVVTSWGEPDRGYLDVKESGDLVEKLTPLLKESHFKPSKIAMIYSDHAKRFYNVESGGIYNHRGLVSGWFTSLVYQGLQVEVIQENSLFDTFDVLMVPFVRHISETLLKKIEKFVLRGGKLIIGPMTGDRTKELAWPKNNGLDRLGEWLQLHQITQFVAKEQDYSFDYLKENAYLEGLVTTFKVPNTWEILARTNMDETLIAKTSFAGGEVVLIGGLPQNFVTNPVWHQLLKNEVVPFDTNQDLIALNKGCVQYRRETQDKIQLYLANMTKESLAFELKKEAIDALTNFRYDKRTHILEPYKYMVLSFDK